MSQLFKILPRRMPLASLPTYATNGELILTTDTDQLFVGKGPSTPIAQAGGSGSGWSYGVGVPSTLIANGDFYLDTATGDIYQRGKRFARLTVMPQITTPRLPSS